MVPKYLKKKTYTYPENMIWVPLLGKKSGSKAWNLTHQNMGFPCRTWMISATQLIWEVQGVPKTWATGQKLILFLQGHAICQCKWLGMGDLKPKGWSRQNLDLKFQVMRFIETATLHGCQTCWFKKMTSCQRRSNHGQVIFLVSIKDPLRSLIHGLVWSRIASVVFAPTIEQESMTSWNVQLHVFHLTHRHFPDCQRCCGPPYQSSSSSVIIILLILTLFPHPHKTGQVSMTWDYFNTGRILYVFTWRYILDTYKPALYI